jgi:hypothetical protein
MKKILFVSLFFLIPFTAYALFTCTEYEYAELKDMDQVTFEKEYCKVLDMANEKMDYAVKTDYKSAWKEADQCTNTLTKMARAYKMKYNKDIPACKKETTEKQ